MAGEYPNPSNLDPASVCPKERFYAMGKTVDTRTPEGIHEIQLFHDSRFQIDAEPFGTIIHEFLDDDSSLYVLQDNRDDNSLGFATLTCGEVADLFSFTGRDAAGQELTASFTVTTTRTKGENNEYYDDIALTQTFRLGELTHFFSGDEHKRLVDTYKAAKFIRENKPHYNFTALQSLFEPFRPLPILPSEHNPLVEVTRR